MRLLILLAALLVTNNSAFAGGKLQAFGNYRMDNKDLRPGLGLAVYEKLGLGLALNSWMGAGESAESGKKWAVGKFGFDFGLLKDVTLGAGVQLDYAESKIQDSLFMKVEYKLWD